MRRGASPGRAAILIPVLAILAGGCAGSGGKGGAAAPAPGRDGGEDALRAEADALLGLRAPPPEPARDGPLEASVEQVVLLALRNNRELAVERLNPVVAATFEEIERGAFDPEVFARFEASDEVGTETDRATRDRFSVKARDTRAEAGMRTRLPTGTEVETVVSHERNASDRAPEQQEVRIGLTATQALLREAGREVNLVRVRQAELDTALSLQELRRVTEAILGEAEIAYWEYVLAGEEIAIFEDSLDLARRQEADTRRRIDVGLLPETEAAAAGAEVARREQALIDARSELEARRLRLLRRIDPGPDGAFDRPVKATSSPRVEPTPVEDVEDRLRLAERMRPDLAEARLRLERNRLETVATRDGLMPRLDLFLAIGKTGFDDRLWPTFGDIGGEARDVTVGIAFSHFLGGRAAPARDRAAAASTLQGTLAVRNLLQRVRLEVRLAVNEVERTRRNIAATRTTREWQEKVAEAERQRFEVGTGTSLQVAQAQRDLLAARIEEVEAIVRHRIAHVSLYLAEGSLLERRGVEVGR